MEATLKHRSSYSTVKEAPSSDAKLPQPQMSESKMTGIAWKIIPFHALPEWLRDNEFIRGGYRPPMFSFRGCFKSMFRLHNETWNIWTHFGGFMFFLALVMGVYVFRDYITGLFEDVVITSLPMNEQLVLSLFFGGAIVCMLCSTLYHILRSHSPSIGLLFKRLDYSGIAFLIAGSSIPAYYYGFYCSWVAQCVHIGVIVVLCGLCIVVSMWKKMQTSNYRGVRYAMFVSFGLYSVVPGVHICLRDGYALACDGFALWGILIMAATYIGGGALYACRIPERFWPGTFDVWASSHQLFHVCVVIASLVHYNALLRMVKYRLDEGSCLDVVPMET